MSGTITALETQKRHKDRVNVYLDGEFAFGLPDIEAARLRTGQTLSDEEIAALRAIDAVSRAVDRAVLLLARRPYSVAEIRRHLAAGDIAPDVIDAALVRLEQLGYVDDQAFARYWIENREQFKPLSPRALRYELRQKGVAADVIEVSLDGLDVHDSAYRAAQSRAVRLRGQTHGAFRSTLGSFLARRGFTYDVIREVLDELITHYEEESPGFFVSVSSDDDILLNQENEE